VVLVRSSPEPQEQDGSVPVLCGLEFTPATALSSFLAFRLFLSRPPTLVRNSREFRIAKYVYVRVLLFFQREGYTPALEQEFPHSLS
jgi:hypothetical protein